MKALVTGAAGFIGSHVTKALVDRGWDVRALVLPQDDPRNLLPLRRDIEIVHGDVTDRGSVTRAMAGVEVVFHLAAIYALFTRDRGRRMHEVNTAGARIVFEVARQMSSVRRVVYTSSIARFGGQGLTRRATEASPFALGVSGDVYARSKAVAHEIAVRMSKDQDIVIVAPCGPIGPSDVGPTPTGRILLSTLEMPVVVTTDTITTFADVRDMAVAHVLAADPEKGRSGETYLLGTEDLSMVDIAEMAFRATGVRKPIVNAPAGVASLAGRALEVHAKWTRSTPLFTSKAVQMARLGLRADCTKAVRELGMPQSPIERAVADAIAWFDAQGMIKGRGARSTPRHAPVPLTAL